MSRISIEVTPEQHTAIKMAALAHGCTLKDFILDKFAKEFEYKPATKISSANGHKKTKESFSEMGIELKELRSKIRSGIESGSSISAEDVFSRLEEKYSSALRG